MSKHSGLLGEKVVGRSKASLQMVIILTYLCSVLLSYGFYMKLRLLKVFSKYYRINTAP